MSQVDVAQEERDFRLGREGPKVVVVGLDASQIHGEGSHATLHAAAYAAGLAQRQGARLVAVWVRPSIAVAETFAETIEEIEHDRDDAAARVRATIEETAARFGVASASLEVREGDPFEELCAVAEEVQADEIVVGASTHRIGSLAAHLIRACHWPVTVVP